MGTRRIDNRRIAAIFEGMAAMARILGQRGPHIEALRHTAATLAALPPDAMVGGGLSFIDADTQRRIDQILESGDCDDHLALKARLPPGLRELFSVRGIGPDTIARLWRQRRIGSIAQLQAALSSGEVDRIGWMTSPDRDAMRLALADHQRTRGLPRAVAQRMGQQMMDPVRDLPGVHRVALAGAQRRGEALVDSLVVVVAASDPRSVIDGFVANPEVARVLARTDAGATVRLHNQRSCELSVLPLQNWGAGLHHATGSAQHNLDLAARAVAVGNLEIGSQGIFIRHSRIRIHPAPAEADVFAAAHLPYIEPELRQGNGEIEAAVAGCLPRLITARDLKGDLHTHTVASDGRGTAAEMATAAMALGYDYIAITDHARADGGLDARRLVAQVRHLRQLQQHLGQIRILAGVEVDILPDGTVGLDRGLLRRLDWVIASVHDHHEMDGAAMTDRLVAAMETGVVDCIGHPLGRWLGQHAGSALELDRLFDAARRTGVALECNGHPLRMDLPDDVVRQARDAGVALCINTDAHAPEHLARRDPGLLAARRGWVRADDVLNTRSWPVLADRRRDRMRCRSGGSGSVGPAADLVEALSERPLDPALRKRLRDWLIHGGDDGLEAALSELGAAPVQIAFQLLHR